MPTASRLVVANERNRVETTLTLAEAAAAVRAYPSTQFAADLARDYDRYRDRLSEGKARWLTVIAQQALDRVARAAEVAEAEPLTADFAGLTALFRAALAAGRKRPAIVLRTAGGQALKLALAGERSRHAGSVQVTDGGGFDDSVWFGRVDTDGRLTPGRAMTEDVRALLSRFAADPAGVAAAYGRETGCCCFCNAELTDERSVLQGYGPVCADNYNLPWGDRPAKGQRGARAATPEPPFRDEADRVGPGSYAALERAREQLGFASDPDYREFLRVGPAPRSLALEFATAVAPGRDDD